MRQVRCLALRNSKEAPKPTKKLTPLNSTIALWERVRKALK